MNLGGVERVFLHRSVVDHHRDLSRPFSCVRVRVFPLALVNLGEWFVLCHAEDQKMHSRASIRCWRGVRLVVNLYLHLVGAVRPSLRPLGVDGRYSSLRVLRPQAACGKSVLSSM